MTEKKDDQEKQAPIQESEADEFEFESDETELDGDDSEPDEAEEALAFAIEDHPESEVIGEEDDDEVDHSFEDLDDEDSEAESVAPTDDPISIFEDDDEEPKPIASHQQTMDPAGLNFDEELTLEGQVEAVIFASAKPLKIQDILDIVQDEDQNLKPKDIESVVSQLQKLYDERSGGFTLVHEAGIGYQFQTVVAASYLMEKMFSSRPRPLSRAALETLSIIAYRQPATRAEIEYIRGVDAGSIIKNLMERDLISCVGRKEDAGRPMLFGTTAEFLKVFRIESLDQLPPLASFQPPAETAEASQKEPEDAVDVEGFVGDDTLEAPEVSEGLESEPEDHELEEEARPSESEELDSEDSFEVDFGSEEQDVMRPGAEHGQNEQIMEEDDGTLKNTEVDISTGPSIPSRSGEVDSGGES
ncbi:SMC-Scp complex subunit ScpB [Pseudobacteriovorax antillogorgiicola]|uniref:Segregation and condensation protein B n=1 Tax=Pseudobacteriovorax antillogorgiicola TaxID=1513793 RepID=A0A1Y6BAD1_9BACT|nr:SMC-Scp complex subunit ScpB [Pseudobacteriovorax antillogorgiicola]TCS59250.1 segregation and condensation protein B [Pseudobacteriovorax antillogorgiicola]SME90066.1 segregation and condensation protein B [Pseudobacteriovorax antillogorgiicola]